MSYQQSVLSEMVETAERKSSFAAPFAAGVGRPHESLVLQLYGISQPSQEFKDRLSGLIRHKLDAAALDIMCGIYSRNQQLKLTPQDLEFLQPNRKPTHTLHLSLPEWLGGGHQYPFFFYLLQTLSTFAVHPVYSSSEGREHL